MVGPARPDSAIIAVLVAVFLVTGCSKAPASAKLEVVDPGDWPNYGRTFDESHYSPLTEIDASNIARLGLAWSHDLDSGPASSVPVAVDGKIYVATGHSVVTAFDGATGRQLWRFDPQAAEAAGQKLRFSWSIRGLAYARNKLFVGTVDGRLIAIDALTGKAAWSVNTVTAEDPLNITGAPRIIGDNVLIGNGGADMAPVRGYVTAYNLETGKQAWRFHTVPGDPAKGFENQAMKMAAKTWSEEALKRGGGGTAWSGLTYDPELGQVYIGVGNGGPWNWKVRNPEGKDNLFLASIVALDARTGEYRWHYQVNPNDAWDYSAAMDMATATLTIDGQPRKILMQAPKNGFFYVLDRTSGKVISAGKPVTVTWAKGIDLASGRPIEEPHIRYETGPVTLKPSFYGGHNWQPMAFSPKTSLVYLSTLEMASTFSDAGIKPREWKPTPGTLNVALAGVVGTPGVRDRGELVAWDPVRQKAAWRVDTVGGWTPGTMATGGGLVFQGDSGGHFHAYAADTGNKLWTFDAKVAVTGAPISYRANGRQYIAVLTSPPTGSQAVLARRGRLLWSYRDHPRRLAVFALDGTAKLPPTAPRQAPVPLHDPAYRKDRAAVAAGEVLYSKYYCFACHGGDVISGGAAPDLRASPVSRSPAAFFAVLHDGALVQNGMPAFSELSPKELEYIRHYIMDRSEVDHNNKGTRKIVFDRGN